MGDGWKREWTPKGFEEAPIGVGKTSFPNSILSLPIRVNSR